MPIVYQSDPPGPVGIGPGYWKWDANAGGWRNDWTEHGGQYKISGEGVDPEVYGWGVAQRDYAPVGAVDNWRELGWGQRGPQRSEDLYYAALAKQGIGREELPFNKYGQEETVRVLQRHKLPIPQYLSPWAQALAGGGGTSTPPASNVSQPSQPGVKLAGAGPYKYPSGQISVYPALAGLRVKRRKKRAGRGGPQI